MLECGDTFLAGDTDNEDFHLWIVITPPIEGEVVTVCVTTKRKRSETLVVLRAGDHPFVVHDSVVAYNYSTIRLVDDIEAALLTGAAKKREPIASAILQRVQVGLLDSDRTPNGVLRYYKDVMGITGT